MPLAFEDRSARASERVWLNSGHQKSTANPAASQEHALLGRELPEWVNAKRKCRPQAMTSPLPVQGKKTDVSPEYLAVIHDAHGLVSGGF